MSWMQSNPQRIDDVERLRNIVEIDHHFLLNVQVHPNILYVHPVDLDARQNQKGRRSGEKKEEGLQIRNQ